MHNHLNPNIPKYRSRGEIHFVKFVYSSIRQLYCCDITDISKVQPERAAYKKLTKTLENQIIDWISPPSKRKRIMLILPFYLRFLRLRKERGYRLFFHFIYDSLSLSNSYFAKNLTNNPTTQNTCTFIIVYVAKNI